MKDRILQGIYYFGWVSIGIGVIQVAIGQFDYNSLLVGIELSFQYFAIGFFFLGFKILIELLTIIVENMK